MKPITTPEKMVHQLGGSGLWNGQIATHLFILLAALIIVHSVSGQTDPKLFSFGNHGVVMSFSSEWKKSKREANQFEFLNGCSSTEHCANIQVAFYGKGSASIDHQIAVVEKEYRSKYKEFIAAKSVMRINGYVFKVADFHLKSASNFTGQTLTMTETKSEQILIVFTGELQPSGRDQEVIYAKKRAQFLSMLQTFRRMWNVKQCNESEYQLIGELDSTAMILPLPGNKARLNKSGLHIDGMSFRPFMVPKEEKGQVADQGLPDSVILRRFILELGNDVSRLLAELQPWTKPPYTVCFQYKVSPGRYGAVWYLTGHIMASRSKDSNYRPKPLSGVVFATVPVGNHFFTLRAFATRGKSLQEMEILLRRMMGSTRIVMRSELDGICSEKVPQSLVDNKP